MNYFSFISQTAIENNKIINNKINNISKSSFYNLYLISSQKAELDISLISKLLNAKFITNYKQYSFIIGPRLGLVSPWASKTLDVFLNCEIKDILNVEKFKIYKIYNEKNELLTFNACLNFNSFFYDKMTEDVFENINNYFVKAEPKKLAVIDILNLNIDELINKNKEMGLALSSEEISYLYNEYLKINKNPTDAELLMFAQVNSEHCRHKIFNAAWTINNTLENKSLFEMIKNTEAVNSKNTLLAYSDNSSVIEGFKENYFEANNFKYNFYETQIDMLMKVETHNHPTGICPYPGASTGVGGEIRDEAATGIGSRSLAGLCGFITSNLKIPEDIKAWENINIERPKRLASPLQIMLEAPIGAASFSNEFGRPNLTGFFKTFELINNNKYYNYHKPIMLAGGMGFIKRAHVFKKEINKSSLLLIQIGGPSLKIGVGGGAASSMQTGSNLEELDFNSVQRDNPQMQRRCQQVIDTLISLNENNPVISIHDVGAGGLSNACSELIENTGADIELRNIYNEDKAMSPMEIWCNEAQERFVLLIEKKDLNVLESICKREACPYAILGETRSDKKLKVHDKYFNNYAVDIDLNIVLKKPPKLSINAFSYNKKYNEFDTNNININEAIKKVLNLPCVSNKTFLISISDRSISGLVARDQNLGKYQFPIANCAVTSSSYTSYTGQACSTGEKINIAIYDAKESARLAVAEAILNLSSSYFKNISNIKLSANWMSSFNSNEDKLDLYEAVKELGENLCPKLGISIPVGKDSLSMKSSWFDSNNIKHEASSPLSVIISAFAKTYDIRKTSTPDFKKTNSSIYMFNFGSNRIGLSSLAYVYKQTGSKYPKLDNEADFVNLVNCIQELIGEDLILSYHDRSDGGLIISLLEMSFSSRIGFNIDISKMGTNAVDILFNEELGTIFEIEDSNLIKINQIINKYKLNRFFIKLGTTKEAKEINIYKDHNIIYSESIFNLLEIYNQLSSKIQCLRDNALIVKQEYLLDKNDPGLNYKLSYDTGELENFRNNIFNIKKTKPKIAILREQGTNGHIEMAAAFTLAGFDSFDVHTNDLINNTFNLSDFQGLAVCGGFSYGDVLGAGFAWANKILANQKLNNMFYKFFNNINTFTLGVCNGCQMLSHLKKLIPGSDYWPTFTRNLSNQFEARYVTVKILDTNSIFFKGMSACVVPIPVAHGEGLAVFNNDKDIDNLINNKQVNFYYVDNYHNNTLKYPFNPNGSINGYNSFSNKDGRITIMMPHPERLFRAIQMSYNDNTFKNEIGPWYKLFKNAYDYCN